MKKIILSVLSATMLLTPLAPHAQGDSLVIAKKGIACPDSMKAMRFARTHVVKPGYDCVVIESGTTATYIGEKALNLSRKGLSQISVETAEFGLFEGYMANKYLSLPQDYKEK